MRFRIVKIIGLARPLNLIMAGMAILIGSILTGGTKTVFEIRTYTAIFSGILLMAGLFILNDIHDIFRLKILGGEAGCNLTAATGHVVEDASGPAPGQRTATVSSTDTDAPLRLDASRR